MIKYDYSEKDKVHNVKLTGTITIKDIISFFKEIKSEGFSNIVKVLTDLRDAELAISVEEIDWLTQIFKKTSQNSMIVREAIIIDKPLETAIYILISESRKSKKYSHRIFCTQEAAIKWLSEVDG